MTQHDHDHHDHSVEGTTHGIALGFRIFERGGKMYFAEAEISAYEDDTESLGATLVFHELSGIDPTSHADDVEWPTWATDIDGDLTRDDGAPVTQQFEAILKQLSTISEGELRDYLEVAMEETQGED